MKRFWQKLRQRKSRLIYMILSIPGFLYLDGCVTQGHDFPSRIDWISKDVTKQKDVLMVLGKPDAVGNSGGTPTWTYGYYRYQLFGDSHIKELKIYWNEDKSVKHFSFSSNFFQDIEAPATPPAKPSKALVPGSG